MESVSLIKAMLRSFMHSLIGPSPWSSAVPPMWCCSGSRWSSAKGVLPRYCFFKSIWLIFLR